MPRIVASYRQSRPNIEIQLREGIQGAVLDDVRSGVADLGITYVDESADEFCVIELGTEVFHVVMPRDHPLSASDGIRIQDLAAADLVSMPKAAHLRKLLDGMASVAGITLRHDVTVQQFATAMQCVRAGVGILVAPGGAVPAAASAGLISRPLAEPGMERAIGAMFLKHRSPTAPAAGFLAHLQANWKKRGAGARVIATA